MAMNKKERAEMDALQQQLAEARAFRFTGPAVRDVPPPSAISSLSRGWDFNAHSLRVYKVCSSSVGHGNGWERTTTQNPRHLFSTESAAYAAMRHELERQYAKALADIDRRIAALADQQVPE